MCLEKNINIVKTKTPYILLFILYLIHAVFFLFFLHFLFKCPFVNELINDKKQKHKKQQKNNNKVIRVPSNDSSHPRNLLSLIRDFDVRWPKYIYFLLISYWN